MHQSCNDTIAAVATGSGGAISVVRVSGPAALDICDRLFRAASGKSLARAKGYTLHYGTISAKGNIVDEVIVSVFRSPRSYTGEDMVEISCHGSPYIRREIMSLLSGEGARPATAGEFTMRAFLAGKMDLSQAEAVADVIAAEDRASHALAVNQIRGGYSREFAALRAELLQLVSLLELELDFSEEDVQFADRERLGLLMEKISSRIGILKESYDLNNAIKEGIPVVIAGEPNTGKSTLLNTLIDEDRAMVSDIPGTTRDVIEQSHVIGGVRFRFTDTAGLRETPDLLEGMGIERARAAIAGSRIVLYVVGPGENGRYDIGSAVRNLLSLGLTPDTWVYLIPSKTDILPEGSVPEPEEVFSCLGEMLSGSAVSVAGVVPVSAKTGVGIAGLKELLAASVDTGALMAGETIVTNARHYDALVKSGQALERSLSGLRSGAPSDLLAEDIRDGVYWLGTITGDQMTPDTVLQNIFANFCIGK